MWNHNFMRAVRGGWIVLAAVLAGSSLVFAEVEKTTYTYKKVGDLEIKLDVYRDAGTEVQPVIVWIHGGALIMGNREGIDKRVRKEFAGQGTILVSLDYRLAPETPLAEIIADLDDAFQYIRKEGPNVFHADPDRLAVIGGSAGGYLTLTAGFRVQPPPVALFSIYGYGNLLAPWYTEPSRHPRHHPEPVTRDVALQQVSGNPVSEDRNRKGNGSKFYLYCRQNGVWPKEVSGWDPRTDAEKFTPYLPIKNVTAKYPPTFFLHGNQDTDVPFEESVEMAAELERHRVEHKLAILAGGEHGFGGADPEAVDQGYREAFQFLRKHLKKKPH